MYSAEKRAKSGPEAVLYSHPLQESCLGEHEVPVPSYYRASPSYSALDKPPHCAGANDFEAPFEQRASLNPRAEHLESPQLGGKVSFPETPKSDSQTPSPNEIKTEQSLAGPKGSPLESEKERAKTADSSPDTSDNEAKGKAAWAVARLGLPGLGGGRERVGPRRPWTVLGMQPPACDSCLLSARLVEHYLAREGKRRSGGAGQAAAVGAEILGWCAPRTACRRLVLTRAGDLSWARAGFGLLALCYCPGGLMSPAQVRSLKNA